MLLSHCYTVSSLAVAIFVVICPSSQKQMIWINTGSIITVMANTHAGRDFSYMNCIRKSVCRLVRTIHFDLSISGGKTSIPSPTSCLQNWMNGTVLAYFTPERFDRIFFVSRKPVWSSIDNPVRIMLTAPSSALGWTIARTDGTFPTLIDMPSHDTAPLAVPYEVKRQVGRVPTFRVYIPSRKHYCRAQQHKENTTSECLDATHDH